MHLQKKEPLSDELKLITVFFPKAFVDSRCKSRTELVRGIHTPLGERLNNRAFGG